MRGVDNNFEVTWYHVFKLRLLLCRPWHRNKYLRFMEASNGGEVFCEKCGMKLVGWIFRKDTA